MFDARVARLLASVIFIWGFQWGVSLGEARYSVGGGELRSAGFFPSTGRWIEDKEEKKKGVFVSFSFSRSRPVLPLSPLPPSRPLPSFPRPPPPPPPPPQQQQQQLPQIEHRPGSVVDPPFSRSSSILLFVVDRAHTWLSSWLGEDDEVLWAKVVEEEEVWVEKEENREENRRRTIVLLPSASDADCERVVSSTMSSRGSSRFGGTRNSSDRSFGGENENEDAERQDEEEEEVSIPMLLQGVGTPRRHLQQQAPPTEAATQPDINCTDFSGLDLSSIELCRYLPINTTCCEQLLLLLPKLSVDRCEREFWVKLTREGYNDTAMKETCTSGGGPSAPTVPPLSAPLPSAASNTSTVSPPPPPPPPTAAATGGGGGGGRGGGVEKDASSSRSTPSPSSPASPAPSSARSKGSPNLRTPSQSNGGSGGEEQKKSFLVVVLACALGTAMLVVLLLLFCLRRRIARSCRVLLCMGRAGEKTGERGLNRGSSSALRSDGSRDASTPAKPEGSGAGGRKDGRFILNRAPEPYTVCKFSLDTLSRATRGFNPDCVIGEPGGFGRVYRGTLDDGRAVAIKMMKGDLSESKYSQFLAEVELQSRLHHTHLCELIGYCDAEESWLLVYPFIPGGTLFEHLHGRPGPMGHRAERLDWPSRVRVALHVSKAIRYLHEEIDPPVLHRDVKSANILLDQNKRAKLADFGLAKLGQSILVDTERGGVEPRRLCGTYGYMAPEYMVWGKLTARNDVYAFGVVLLEICTGRRAVVRGEEGTLATWVRPYLDNINDFKSIVDPILLKWGVDDLEEIFELACLAGECTHGTERLRPAMSSVVERISKIASNHPVR